MTKKSILKSFKGVFWALMLAALCESVPGFDLEILSHFRLNPPDVRAFEEGGANRNRIEVGPSGSVYVAFSGLLKGKTSTDVFFRRFLPQEKRWGELVQLSQEELLSRAPAIWLGEGEKIHYAWLAHGGTQAGDRVGLRYRKSEDGGSSWSETREFDLGVVLTRVPILEGDDQGNLYLCISNKGEKEEHERVILFRSGDQGDSWEEIDVHNGEERLSAVSQPGLVVGPGGKAYLTWLDPTAGGRAVVFARTVDGGKSWSKAVPLNDDLTRILSDPIIELDQGKIKVMWVEASGRRNSIYLDYSDDGGKSWNPDQLLYREPVSEVILKSTQVHDKVLLSWKDYRELLWQRGEHLLYQLYPRDKTAEDGDRSNQQSLTGKLENLLSFRGFEVTPFGGEGCIGVYSKKAQGGRPTIYLSWSQKLAEGFEEVLEVSKDDGTKASLWPRIRKVSDSELVILYHYRPVKSPIDSII